MSKDIQFFIGQSGNGKYFAASTSELFFCIERDTAEDAAQAGLKAFTEFYNIKDSSGCIEIKESNRSDWTSPEIPFTPIHVIKGEAVACR